MRTFSWEYFTLTGDVDAYLLYRDMHLINNHHDAEDELVEEEEQQTTGNYL